MSDHHDPRCTLTEIHSVPDECRWTAEATNPSTVAEHLRAELRRREEEIEGLRLMVDTAADQREEWKRRAEAAEKERDEKDEIINNQAEEQRKLREEGGDRER